jgi:uncharacterized hydrophobic protein (TIGR00271 family)
MNYFNKKLKQLITAFQINETRQKKVYNEIKENAKGDFDFFILNIFSGIIITLGLIVNSSAVIIGGMIISPMFWPILSLALGIIKANTKLVQTSVFTIMRVSALIFLISAVFGLIAPNSVFEGNEFISRTSPTLFELLIALATGFAAAFIVTYPKIGAAFAGAAIAVALVPPISIIGISLAHSDFNAAAGAFILYISNLLAITFSSIILFYLAKFKAPSTQKAQEKRTTNIAWTIIFLFVIIIPLSITTFQSFNEYRNKNIIIKTIESKIPTSIVKNIKIIDKDEVSDVTVRIEYAKMLKKEDVDRLSEFISKKIDKPLILKIIIIPIIEAGGSDSKDTT